MMSLKIRIAFLIIFCLPIVSRAQLPKYDIQIVSCIESLVPGGLGRSRMISPVVKVDYSDFTSQQTGEKKNKNKSKRKNIRIKDYEETKLLNFYNEGGIRFQNIVSNDALVTSKLNEMLANGWELFDVKTDVESKMANASIKKELLKAILDENSESPNDPNGLFLTRYYFRKEIK
ncbi:hypothetical protein [uncultured Draconibacterium sp.]|uniref:hypothetical protein n=1 Tax=uncultured Draconibacterium sp. TaxID=1573823 RepID=UPI0025EDB089|nr:hypothetical protein [uncultured Draconibacterium sp.]